MECTNCGSTNLDNCKRTVVGVIEEFLTCTDCGEMFTDDGTIVGEL